MIESIYRHFLLPGFESWIKRRHLFQYLSELEASQWWPAEKLAELQLQRLRDMLQFCYQHSPYYRQLWDSHALRVSQLSSLADFTAWPITSRETLREQANLIQTTRSSAGLIRKATGGSSGVPLQFVLDKPANDRRMASTLRGYAWAGATPGSKQTHLWGVPLGNASYLHRTKQKLFHRWLHRRDMINSFAIYADQVPQIVARINRYRPKVIVAYSNPLFSLARIIAERQLPVHSPRAVIVGAEKLYDHQRQLIERVFKAPVYETYGSREFSLIGAECERHRGFHITCEQLVVEVLNDDGSPTPCGHEGKVVITDLFNRALPFIRYEIGDRAVVESDHCNCGRGLPLLGKLTGRQVDMLTTADGRQLAGELFPHLLKDYAAVRQFQVIQRTFDEIEIKLVVHQPWTVESRETIRQTVQQAIGSATKLRIDEVDHIPLTPAGKLRVVVAQASSL